MRGFGGGIESKEFPVNAQSGAGSPRRQGAGENCNSGRKPK